MDDSVRASILSKSLDTTVEWSKQLITLSTTVIVLSASLLNVVKGAPVSSVGAIKVSWGLLSVSLVLGILYLGTVADVYKSSSSRLDILDLNYTRRPGLEIAIVQICTFLGGMLAFIIFAWQNLPSR